MFFFHIIRLLNFLFFKFQLSDSAAKLLGIHSVVVKVSEIKPYPIGYQIAAQLCLVPLNDDVEKPHGQDRNPHTGNKDSKIEDKSPNAGNSHGQVNEPITDGEVAENQMLSQIKAEALVMDKESPKSWTLYLVILIVLAFVIVSGLLAWLILRRRD